MEWETFWNESAQVKDADFCRQVGRTFRNQPYSERELELTARRLLVLLRPGPGAALLDVACGNGLITSRLAPHFSTVTAIDYSAALIDTATRHFACANVRYRVGDGAAVPLEGRYDRVLVSAALQFFDQKAAERLLRRLRAVVSADGRLVLGDVADGDGKWRFYRGLRGRWRYAWDELRNRPIIGHWWRPDDLARVAAAAGWTLTVHHQPSECPNHYFRYDSVLTPVRVGTSRRSGT
jgi:cyclopropane fatty-acyl-phospholipid synthase-like methyltransferase